MYIATFENSYRISKELGRAESVEKAIEYIDDFLAKMNYTSPYWRYVGEPNNENGMMIDVGSHSEFFYIKEVKEDDTKTV